MDRQDGWAVVPVLCLIVLFSGSCVNLIQSNLMAETQTLSPTSSLIPATTSTPRPTRVPQEESNCPAGGWTLYTEENGLPGTDLRVIAVGPDGLIWAADFYGRISRMYSGEWSTLPARPIPEINVILPLDTGELWIGTQGGRVAIFENYDWQGPPRVVPMEKGGTAVYDLAISPQGHLWAATWDGLFELWGNDWEMIPKPVPGDALYSPKSLYFDRQGGLWVGARHSFNYYQDGVWSGPSDGLPDLVNVEEIVEDSSGKLWFGGLSGLIGYDGENWSKVFLPGEDLDGFAMVESLAVDAAGQIWLVSNQGKVFYQDGTWQPVIPEVGSPDISIRSVDVDPWGALWFVSSEGVLCYSP